MAKMNITMRTKLCQEDVCVKYINVYTKVEQFKDIVSTGQPIKLMYSHEGRFKR